MKEKIHNDSQMFTNEKVLAMTKKYFVALARVIRSTMPPSMLEDGIGLNTKMQRESRQNQWREMRDAIADFCASQNSQFDRERFLAACGVKG